MKRRSATAISPWLFLHFTSNPSSRKHCLCKLINFIHSGSSSPLNTRHSSRCFLVSGQQQHIGLPDFIPNFFLGLSATCKVERGHYEQVSNFVCCCRRRFVGTLRNWCS